MQDDKNKKEEKMNETDAGATENLEALRAQCEEYLNGWKRAQADYANLKRETEVRQQEMREQAKIQAIHEFLPVYTHLQTAITHIPDVQRSENWAIGLEHIIKQFDEVLTGLGLQRIPTVGEKFNPEFHEAVGKQSQEGVGSEMVVSESAPGYLINNKVIIPAKVIVAE